MPIGSRLTVTKSEYHSDVINLNNRVITAGGSMTSTVLSALSAFVRWCYVNGVRTGNSSTEIIRWLWVPLTQDFNGALEKLWYPSGTNSALTNSGFSSSNYAQLSGLTGTGSAYLQTGFTPSTHLPSGQDAHFALYSRDSFVQSDGHGTLIAGNRLMLQPGWSGSSDADYLNKRTSFTGYNGGLLMLNNLSATSLKIWHRGVQKNSNTNSTSNVNSSINLQMYLYATNSSTGAGNYSTRSLSGASVGAAFPESLMSDYSTQWQSLLASINSSRPV